MKRTISDRADEMDGARRLPAAEYIDQPRQGRVETGRHGQAGEHDQRQDDEDQAEIGELLEDVVVAAVAEAEPHVVDDRAADAAELAPVGTRSRQTWRLRRLAIR